MTHPNHERGGVLLYAVIAVAFLSGLSLYLQKMSDPKIFQTNDTQKILNTEYLSDSMETLLSITASNNSTLLKNKSDIIDNSTNNVTTNFIANVKNIFENQKKIFLFSKENVLIASASKLLSLSLITYHFFCVHLQNKRNFKNRENPGYGKLYCFSP